MMAASQPYSALRVRLSPAAQAESLALADKLEEEMGLANLRRALKRSQTEIGQILEVNQGSVAKIEKRGDMLVSSLRRYVEALGGELEMVACFGDRRVRIKRLADLVEPEQS